MNKTWPWLSHDENNNVKKAKSNLEYEIERNKNAADVAIKTAKEAKKEAKILLTLAEQALNILSKIEK